MELYQTETDAEKILSAKADLMNIPLGGTIELLPLCNMRCKMCYVYQSKAQMVAAGEMLSASEWLKIAEQGVHEGLLFLLLTGGEPLLYPEFKTLYRGLSRLGLVLSVNTNATLLDESWADFFSENGCRRFSITLYGKDNETYEKLCGNPNGFTQVMKALQLLKERKLPFRLTCSVTPENVDQLPDLYKIACEMEAPFVAATYLFPAERRGISAKNQYRLSPEAAAEHAIQCFQYHQPNANLALSCRYTLSQMQMPPRYANANSFTCKAGHSGFWLNWKGEMLPCGMFSEPAISLLDHTFKQGWDFIVQEALKIPNCQKCVECKWQNICSVCPASRYTETGHFDGVPEYQCIMTAEKIRLMEEYIQSSACATKEGET